MLVSLLLRFQICFIILDNTRRFADNNGHLVQLAHLAQAEEVGVSLASDVGTSSVSHLAGLAIAFIFMSTF